MSGLAIEAEDFNITENRRIDALTNVPMPRLEAEIRNASDLAELRARWAQLDSIPRTLAGREEGVDQSWLDLDIRGLLLGDESSGRFSIHDIILPPGAELPLCYLEEGHTYIWVVDGEVELRIGDMVETASQGAFGYAPARTRHGVKNQGKAPGQILVAYAPAGSDRAFEAARAHGLATGDRDLATYREILGRYGFRFDDVRLENDGRVNAPVARLEADIQVVDDLHELRSRWLRQAPAPRLRTAAANAKSLKGNPSIQLVDGDASSGHSICSLYAPQPGYKAHLHHQPDEEEMFYFLDGGDYDLLVGNATVRARRGAFAMAPRFATHGGVNKSDHPVRFFGVNAPAGHERAYDMLIREGHSPRLPELFKAYGFHLLEPLD